MEWSSVAFVLVLLLGLALLALHAVALLQISAAPAMSVVERIAWIAGVLLVPYLGAIAWFLHGRGRSQRLTEGASLTPNEQTADRVRRAIMDRTRGATAARRRG